MLNIEIFFIIMWMPRKSNWITTLVLLHKAYFMLRKKEFRMPLALLFRLSSHPGRGFSRCRDGNELGMCCHNRFPAGSGSNFMNELWSSFIKFYAAGRIIIFLVSSPSLKYWEEKQKFLIRGNVCRINLSRRPERRWFRIIETSMAMRNDDFPQTLFGQVAQD